MKKSMIVTTLLVLVVAILLGILLTPTPPSVLQPTPTPCIVSLENLCGHVLGVIPYGPYEGEIGFLDPTQAAFK